MDDIIKEFMEETVEGLSALDDKMITLEENPSDDDAVRTAFRIVHTIKGTCGFLGLTRLERVAHDTENLLGAFRDGKLEPNGERMQVIFEAIDRIKDIVNDISENEGEESEGDDSDILNQIRDIIAKSSDNESSGDEAGPEQGDADESGPEEDEGQASGGSDGSGEADAQGDDAANDVGDNTPKETDSEASKEANSGKAESGAKQPQGDERKAAASHSIRVNTDDLDSLMTIISELVLTRNQLMQIDRQQQEETSHSSSLQRLDQIVSEAQEAVMRTRMQPIGQAWKTMPRIVRDLSRELGKKISLETSGEDAELDRQLLDAIKSPLTHIIRNAADHGIESTEDRVSAGKPEHGTIWMRARQEAGHVVIEIEDDGGGLNARKIGEKAVSKGLAAEADLENMPESQIVNFLFRPGFSTADEVTAVSGRGVGMDVVRQEIEKIGGSIDVSTEFGKGTRFSLKIPLTLAIITALIVEAAGERFAVPQSGVVELVRVARSKDDTAGAKIEQIRGAHLLRLRNRLLPLLSLSSVLGIEDRAPSADRDRGRYVIVMQVGSQSFGVIVDKVFDNEEIVVKPNSMVLSDISAYSGSTILGDGSIVMILDPNGIAPPADEIDKAAAANKRESSKRAKEIGSEDDTGLLVFSTGYKAPKACPLDLIKRLEEIDPSTIEYGDDQALVQYRGDLMPVIPFDETVSLEDREDGEKLPLLVFEEDEKRLAIAVSKIDDILHEPLKIRYDSGRKGILGSAIISGKTTDIVDVGDFLDDFGDWFSRTEHEVQKERRALYVDDSRLVRSTMMPVLHKAGFKVVTASDVAEAREVLAETTEFDLVISDIEMPGTDGRTFASELRERKETTDIPKIALSSLEGEENIEKSLEAGFKAHVGKYDRQRLFDTIQEVVGG